MSRFRFSVVFLALGLAACGGGPRPIYEPPPVDRTARETPRPPIAKPPAHGAVPGVVAAAPIPQALAGPLTVARIEPYMDALETDLRRHVHARGLVTARRGDEIAIVIENSLLFAPDGGVAGDDVLEPLAAILRGYGHTAIAVNGYTDTAGTPERNMAVSQRRARAIADALAHEGVPAGRLAAQGFGEAHLRVMTGDGKAEPRNRRIEILIRPAPG
ncbi:MAG: OmpA family protein [Rhizomicrobium sp.]